MLKLKLKFHHYEDFFWKNPGAMDWSVRLIGQELFLPQFHLFGYLM